MLARASSYSVQRHRVRNSPVEGGQLQEICGERKNHEKDNNDCRITIVSYFNYTLTTADFSVGSHCEWYEC